MELKLRDDISARDIQLFIGLVLFLLFWLWLTFWVIYD